MEKKFKLGFIYGRFQMLHKGHEQLIDLGLQYCEKFVVLVGSANESKRDKNPFTFEERKEMIKTVYGDKVIVLPIVDIGIGYVPEWGNYLINTIEFNCGEMPDFVVEGSESGRSEWLNNYPNITRVIISRGLIEISATEVRNLLIDKVKEQQAAYEIENRCLNLGITEDDYTGVDTPTDRLAYQLKCAKGRLKNYERELKEKLSDKYTKEQLDAFAEIVATYCHRKSV